MSAVAWLLMTLIVPAHAYATKCVPAPFEEMVAKADVIFWGRVLKNTPAISENRRSEPGICQIYSKDNPRCGAKTVVLKVKKVWKGEKKSRFSVHSDDACICLGTYFDKGHDYIVFAKRDPNDSLKLMANNVCLGTQSYKVAEEEGIVERLNSVYVVKPVAAINNLKAGENSN